MGGALLGVLALVEDVAEKQRVHGTHGNDGFMGVILF